MVDESQQDSSGRGPNVVEPDDDNDNDECGSIRSQLHDTSLETSFGLDIIREEEHEDEDDLMSLASRLSLVSHSTDCEEEAGGPPDDFAWLQQLSQQQRLLGGSDQDFLQDGNVDDDDFEGEEADLLFEQQHCIRELEEESSTVACSVYSGSWNANDFSPGKKKKRLTPPHNGASRRSKQLPVGSSSGSPSSVATSTKREEEEEESLLGTCSYSSRFMRLMNDDDDDQSSEDSRVVRDDDRSTDDECEQKAGFGYVAYNDDDDDNSSCSFHSPTADSLVESILREEEEEEEAEEQAGKYEFFLSDDNDDKSSNGRESTTFSEDEDFRLVSAATAATSSLVGNTRTRIAPTDSRATSSSPFRTTSVNMERQQPKSPMQETRQQQQQPYYSQSSSPSNDTNEETSSEEDDDDEEEAMTPSISAIAVSPDDGSTSGYICCRTTTTLESSSSSPSLSLPTKRQQGRRYRIVLGALAFLPLTLCASLAGAFIMGRKLHESTADVMLGPLHSGTGHTISDNEQLELDRLRRVVQKYCVGVWSGASRTYRPKKNRLDLDNRTDPTFVRHIQRQTSLEPPAQQLEIAFDAFDEGIILHIPRDVGGRQQEQTESSPRRRLVWEIDFWDATTRRTAVAAYRPRRVPWQPKRWYLDDVAAVQMQREEPKTPREETTTTHEFDDDCNIQAFQVHQVESVHLETMKRRWKRTSSSFSIADVNERGLIHERIIQAFNTSTTTGQQTNGGAAGTSANERILRGLLSNQMLVSLPASIGTMETADPRRIHNDDEKPPLIRGMFALCWHDRGRINLPVVEVTYHAETAKAQTVTLYSLRR